MTDSNRSSSWRTKTGKCHCFYCKKTTKESRSMR